METTKNERWTWAILHSGREIDDMGAGEFSSEADALADGEANIDFVCPSGSPLRRFYRVEARRIAE